MGELTDKVKGGVNKVIGEAKQKSADPATRQKGADQELKGRGQKVKGAIKGALGNDI